MGSLWAGVRALFRREAESREMDEELRDYLDRAAEAATRAGLTAEEARRSARLQMGSVEGLKDEIRSVGWEEGVASLWRDLRFGTRLLLRRPGFTIVAALSLALGIGANTAIFSVVDAFLLRRLPVRHPEELFTLQRQEPGNVG